MPNNEVNNGHYWAHYWAHFVCVIFLFGHFGFILESRCATQAIFVAAWAQVVWPFCAAPCCFGVSTMPPALGFADLKSFGPSKQELEAAKKLLASADSKFLKSKMQSMSQWLQKHPDTVVTSSRGQQRQQYLEMFVCHQLKAKMHCRKQSTPSRRRQREASMMILIGSARSR